MVLAHQLAVAEQIDVGGVAADRHVDRQADARPEQAAADKGDAVVMFLEQLLLLFQPNDRRAIGFLLGVVLGVPAEIDIGEPDAERLESLVGGDRPDRAGRQRGIESRH